MQAVQTFLFQSHPLLPHQQQLVCTDEFIELSFVGKKKQKKIIITKDQLAGYRFGVRWIKGYALNIGRDLQIQLRSTNNQVIKIQLKSIYGYKRKQQNELFAQLLRELWKRYFTDQVNSYLERIKAGETVEICGTQITSEGILLEINSLLQKNSISALGNNWEPNRTTPITLYLG